MNGLLKDKNIIDVVKYRWLWLGISALLIIPGIVAMIYLTATTGHPLKLGIDFTGGTLLQYGVNKQLSSEDVAVLRDNLTKAGIENPIIQVSNDTKGLNQQEKAETEKQAASNQKTEAKADKQVSQTSKDQVKSVISIRTRFLESEKANNEVAKVNQTVEKSFGEYVPLQVSSIGPTLGSELFKNAVAAMLLAFVAIVGYLTIRFKLDYAMFALFALAHDALFVCGVFAIMGILFHTEIDSLFITAILTVIGFSVHDTIVVFDRIRENSRFLAKKKSFNEIVNASVNQTLARSINTSLTAMLTLLALYLLGGVTTKDFVLAMLLGIAIGTYSSIFNASTLLAMWRSKKENNGKLNPAAA